MCAALGRWNHPDDMLAELTAEQWRGWYAAYCQSAFGEQRSDERQAAGVLWGLAKFGGASDLPELLHPYFLSEEEKLAALSSRATALEELARSIDQPCPPASPN